VLPGEIALKAKELHIPFNAFRAVFLIKVEKARDIQSNEVIQSLFPNRAKDFVLPIDEENTVLVKELKAIDDLKEINRTAKAIIATLNTELMVKGQIGIGSIVDNVRDIGRSFKEAQTALRIGSIFENDNTIINYNNLGIGRLIYQLPTTLCKLFLKEVFKEGSFEALDQETLFTIQKFFENDLNVSETSRELYVHRNTLVYRLDKIQKITGLDLRKFDDAIIFKVSMLVKKYLEKTEKP
jgi:carbohydrate diacid regulator